MFFPALGFPYYNHFVKKRKKCWTGCDIKLESVLVSYSEMVLSIPSITSEVCYEIISIAFLIFARVV